MTRDDVEILRSQTEFEGFFRLRSYRVRYRRYDGAWSAPHDREVFERGHAVGVLPYDPIRDEVLLIEQFRHGAFIGDAPNPWLLEVVAGIIDPGHDAEAVIRREMREEAGLDIGKLIPCRRFFTSPGGSSETFTLYIGAVDSSGAGGVHGLDNEAEDIMVHRFKTRDALALLETDRANNAPLIIALQYLALNAERVREILRNDIPQI